MVKNYIIFYIFINGLIFLNIGFSFTYKPEQKQKTSLKDSKEEGGIGFEEIAKSLGWKTNENPKYLNDVELLLSQAKRCYDYDAWRWWVSSYFPKYWQRYKKSGS